MPSRPPAPTAGARSTAVPRTTPARPGGATSYWALSRTPRHSLLLALPLLLAYEGLAALLGDLAGVTMRNGADVWLKTPFLLLFGPRGPVVFGALLVGGATALVWRDLRQARSGVRPAVRRGVLLGMLAESAALAVVCGLVVGTVTAELLQALPGATAQAGPDALGALGAAARDAWAAGTALAAPSGAPSGDAGGLAGAGLPGRLMIALGAGLYEELLFRVVLVGALGAVARRVLGFGPVLAGAVAVVGGAVLFALAHHVGPLGEPLALQPFTFRAVAGLFFSALYVLRGFGIAAWTHALYDVLVMVVR